jgi:hypothetical protein
MQPLQARITSKVRDRDAREGNGRSAMTIDFEISVTYQDV